MVSEFLDDVAEGSPGHGDEFERQGSLDGGDAAGRTRWLVADASLPRAEAADALRDALTWPRVAGSSTIAPLSGLAAVLGGVLGIAIAVWGLGLVEWLSWAGLGAQGAAGASIAVGGVLAERVHRRAQARQRAATHVARDFLVEVPASFATWAGSDGRPLAHDDLVALARALSATQAAASTLDAWRWDAPDVDWPHAHAVVDPVLVGEYEAARAVLDELAARHGWSVPAEVAPESLR
jgi:hypothetical protein